MKHLFLPILGVLILASSCNKGGFKAVESDYFLKFKLNGNWVTWTKALGNVGPHLADDSKTDLSVTGQSDDNAAILDIKVQVIGSRVGAGSYCSDEYILPIIYIRGGGASADSYTLGSIEGKDPSRYTVTITSITEGTICGTFTGNYLENESEENSAVDITEGEFKVKRWK